LRINKQLIDINSEFFAYIIGLFQTDGSLTETTRNRGKLSIELNKKDEKILYIIQEELKKYGITSTITYRKRNTNFKDNYESTVLNIFDFSFRIFLKRYIPVGKKSDIIKIPKDLKFEYQKHYIRGLFDGDGSLGFEKNNNRPFISLTTSSTDIYNFINEYFYLLTNQKKDLTPNKRDNLYNIMYNIENAQIIADHLYKDSTYYIERKYNTYLKILNWKRPDNMIKVNQKKWDKEQDLYIQTHTIEESMLLLNRSKNSIETRLWRLNKKQI
jgi:hypothetical protein